MKEILGYADRLTVRPGERIAFKVSCEKPGTFDAALVRLINGDTVSADPRFCEIEVDSHVNGTYIARSQRVHPGSCVVVPGEAFEAFRNEFTLAIRCCPTAPQRGRQILIARGGDASVAGWSLHLDERGYFGFALVDGSGKAVEILCPNPVRAQVWYQVILCVDAKQGLATLKVFPLGGIERFVVNSEPIEVEVAGNSGTSFPASDLPLTIGAGCLHNEDHRRIIPLAPFNGRIEQPMILGVILSREKMDLLAAGGSPSLPAAACLAHWDFSREQNSDWVIDLSVYARHGRTHNLPLRSVKGSVWDGTELCWRHAPGQYSAIHFHDDDLYDCGWTDDFALDVPEALASGIYAMRLQQSTAEEYIPFFVAAHRTKPTARLAFMVPTYTYLAYGNNDILGNLRKTFGVDRATSHEFMKSPGTQAYDESIEVHRILGGSTYDCHSDGSPVHFSSALRPLLNLRPKTVLWTFCADLLYIEWLEHCGIDCDIITDDLVDKEGYDLLSDYQCVMTGNHPEYPTTRMLNAIDAYLENGGRFMYMGGNGFYWRSATSVHYPGAIEVRRGRTGTLAWKSEVGEVYHQFTGELGGLWREIGRPPQQLFGVGFIAQGYGPSYYRVQPEAKTGRAAFILEGVNEDTFGDFGLFGGAAGEEIDQVNPAYGTPEHTVVVARSEQHGPGMMYVLEEMSATYPLEVYQPHTYADVIFFETPAGGAVFATGSMAWCGSLGENDFSNSVSTVTENVVRRFLDPAPFDQGKAVGSARVSSLKLLDST